MMMITIEKEGGSKQRVQGWSSDPIKVDFQGNFLQKHKQESNKGPKEKDLWAAICQKLFISNDNGVRSDMPDL